ncbi:MULTISPECIES: PPOX class F420-dependent oxidoreductase [Mycobacterium]|uniref:Pyridoxamine 5'-phosphate oxidase n=1 Tax=Mycobacterium talmoniae TaxID=1858794 RepID=A0A1S1NG10_9MYCO|nr:MULTISPECIES: PPOX class F420-dependent oxidoreductase [Mycobacterium]OHV00691.1 pyridoxamine 5'-phosphate oxidase [Mycobacterium talmoniae]TDH56823.1 PPOX class F420-dependent oxidoreductase [Mycobacterium eburneum]
MVFTKAELAFLRKQPIGRLCTVGPGGKPQVRPVNVHLGSDDATIEIFGPILAQTQKWRNIIHNPQVSFIVDHVIPQPRNIQGIEIRGTATTLPRERPPADGFSGDIIRITPRRIVAWGIDEGGTHARDV